MNILLCLLISKKKYQKYKKKNSRDDFHQKKIREKWLPTGWLGCLWLVPDWLRKGYLVCDCSPLSSRAPLSWWLQVACVRGIGGDLQPAGACAVKRRPSVLQVP